MLSPSANGSPHMPHFCGSLGGDFDRALCLASAGGGDFDRALCLPAAGDALGFGAALLLAGDGDDLRSALPLAPMRTLPLVLPDAFSLMKTKLIPEPSREAPPMP
mmetsp:Transcript_18027/g.31146  ORF Transcript_18027/g.31146 Transcript_18027/m.31146 type:complete len:105 (-) Transcript_18027:32-346(-)